MCAKEAVKSSESGTQLIQQARNRTLAGEVLDIPALGAEFVTKKTRG